MLEYLGFGVTAQYILYMGIFTKNAEKFGYYDFKM